MSQQIPPTFDGAPTKPENFASGSSKPEDSAPPLQSPRAPMAPTADKILDETLTKIQDTLGEHKGKLAIGAAATLGLMIFYKWREKNLAKEDPQEFARLQRFKNSLRSDEAADKAALAASKRSLRRDHAK